MLWTVWVTVEAPGMVAREARAGVSEAVGLGRGCGGQTVDGAVSTSLSSANHPVGITAPSTGTSCPTMVVRRALLAQERRLDGVELAAQPGVVAQALA